NWKTAEELMKDLKDDPEFLRRQEQKAERSKRLQEQFSLLESPVLEKLSQLGYEASSLSDVVKNYSPLADPIVHVLLDAVKSTSDVKFLEWLIRSLAAAAHPFDGAVLVECYKRFSDWNLQWVILNTVACAKPHSIDDWIAKCLADPMPGKTLRDLGYGQ